MSLSILLETILRLGMSIKGLETTLEAFQFLSQVLKHSWQLLR